MKKLILNNNLGFMRLFFAFLFLPQLFFLAVPAHSASTPWQTTLGGKVRLITGGNQAGHYKAGLEIVLDAGWKTYWKVPGDSGIPPILDLTASHNVAQSDILWPVPTRITVAGSHILGYRDAIVFPIMITPADADRPVKLKVDTQLGLCAELCVPLSASFSLTIPNGGAKDPGSELLIDRDLQLVPQSRRDGFAITDLRRETNQGEPDRLVIQTEIPDGYGTKDLFVEGPDDWFLPLTRPLSDNSERRQHFELILDGLPEASNTKGVRLTFTLTNGDEAVQESIRLEQ